MILRTHSRRGLSLLEVLCALAVFLVALLGIGQLLSFASDRALDAQQQGMAALLCQSRLAQVVAGVEPLTSQDDVPCEEDPDYQWSLACEAADLPGLWNVRVTVGRERADGSRVECVLSQMVREPARIETTTSIP